MMDFPKLNDPSPLQGKRIAVTGGHGFLGKALCRRMKQQGLSNVFAPSRRDFDLTCERDVEKFFEQGQPDVVIHLAAEVGGIGANRRAPGRFFYANLAMGMHLIEHARKTRLDKFVQVGTVCAYPKNTPVPFREEDLWEGFPEETNAPYGVAKKALGVMLEAYRSQYGMRSALVIPVNLYGPRDNFDTESSHVIPALIRRFLAAREAGDREVTVWGSGRASREFLYVDDAAEGILRAAERIEDPTPINLGTGEEVTIARLARRIATLSGFEGEIVWDERLPDGQPRRCLDTSRARQSLDWVSRISFEEGLRRTIQWYAEEQGRFLPTWTPLRDERISPQSPEDSPC